MRRERKIDGVLGYRFKISPFPVVISRVDDVQFAIKFSIKVQIARRMRMALREWISIFAVNFCGFDPVFSNWGSFI